MLTDKVFPLPGRFHPVCLADSLSFKSPFRCCLLRDLPKTPVNFCPSGSVDYFHTVSLLVTRLGIQHENGLAPPNFKFCEGRPPPFNVLDYPEHRTWWTFETYKNYYIFVLRVQAYLGDIAGSILDHCHKDSLFFIFCWRRVLPSVCENPQHLNYIKWSAMNWDVSPCKY